jgi:hypothetical protein
MLTFQQANEASADSGSLLPKLYHCTHCGEFVGKTMKLYCADCSHASKRKEMCDENKIINPNWKCTMCQVY